EREGKGKWTRGMRQPDFTRVRRASSPQRYLMQVTYANRRRMAVKRPSHPPNGDGLRRFTELIRPRNLKSPRRHVDRRSDFEASLRFSMIMVHLSSRSISA